MADLVGATAFRTVLLAGVMALTPLSTLQADEGSPTGPEPAVFVPPRQPVTLTRTLQRELRDGRTITAIRRYRLQFEPAGSEFRVAATFLDATVDAPAQLAALSALERNRPDPGFSLRLDARGQVIASDFPSDQALRDQLGAQAGAVIARSELSPAERQLALAALQQILRASGASAVPFDLFNPRAPEQRLHRTLNLEDGSAGEIDVVLVAGPMTGEGGVRHYSRTVTTTLAGSRQVSREDFAITPD